jgi:hypothetical protein
MGTEPEDPCIPHYAGHRTVLVLHMSYVLLTGVIVGMRIVRYRTRRTFRFQAFWNVPSLHLFDGKPVI